MTDITALRQALATNLATISGLRTDSEVPDSPNPPVAIVELERIDYDGALQQGLTTLEFKIIVIVSRQSDRVSQRLLNDYASQNGSRSIKIAVESDRSLNNTEYAAIEFSVVVYV